MLIYKYRILCMQVQIKKNCGNHKNRHALCTTYCSLYSSARNFSAHGRLDVSSSYSMYSLMMYNLSYTLSKMLYRSIMHTPQQKYNVFDIM
jgi:hypothetical protein